MLMILAMMMDDHDLPPLPGDYASDCDKASSTNTDGKARRRREGWSSASRQLGQGSSHTTKRSSPPPIPRTFSL